MTANLSVDTEHLSEAVRRLESIATSLEKTIGSHRASLSVAPAGSDEVSVAAAKSFSDSAELFSDQLVKGISAIRDVAGALREQTSAVDSHDEAVAGDLTAL